VATLRFIGDVGEERFGPFGRFGFSRLVGGHGGVAVGGAVLGVGVWGGVRMAGDGCRRVVRDPGRVDGGLLWHWRGPMSEAQWVMVCGDIGSVGGWKGAADICTWSKI
jgi:hypothetical protein